YFLSAAVAGLVPTATAQPAADKVDILGIRLGMTKADALKVIREYNPEMVFQDEQSRVWPEASAEASLPTVAARKILPPPPNSHDRKLTELIRVVLSGVAGEDRVLALERAIVFADGSQPSLQQLTTDLRDKFGEPTERTNESLLWNYGPAGKAESQYR